MPASSSYYARGKILLSGEYAVIKGAYAIAVPSCFGQHLRVTSHDQEGIYWESLDHRGNSWFRGQFDRNLSPLSVSDDAIAQRLSEILQIASKMAGKTPDGVKFTSMLEFPNDWGLGSSSSLIYLLAQYFEIHAMELFFSSSKGSGYDVACAGCEQGIGYQLREGKAEWAPVDLPDVFKKTVFIHLGHKQDSSSEVRRFLDKPVISKEHIDRISEISRSFLSVKSEGELSDLIVEHEKVTSQLIGLQPIKDRLFKDFQGAVKSLGAWGGDFVMALGQGTETYFKDRGYQTVRPFERLLLG